MFENENLDIIKSIFKSDPNFIKLLSSINNAGSSLINVSGIEPSIVDIFVKLIDLCLPEISFMYTSKNYKASSFSYFKIDFDLKYRDVIEILESLNDFEKVPIIDNERQYTVAGDRVDIYLSGDSIFRISFFGDDIDEISLRDYLTFRVLNKVDKIYIPKNKEIYISSYKDTLLENMVHFNDNGDISNEGDSIVFDYMNIPKVSISSSNFRLIIPNNINSFIIHSKNSVPEFMENEKIVLTDIDFPSGFMSERAKFAVLTDRELYGEFNLNLYRVKKSKRIVTDFLDGKIYEGDYIVHINHGIGIYRGTTIRETDNGNKEYIKIEYAQGDKLFIPLEISERITKYISDNETKPKLTRLGTLEWKHLRERVEKDIEMIAMDIVMTHAQRMLAKKIIPDISKTNTWESEFESQFEHIETKDQLSAIIDVRNDLYSDKVMDRLIVGDVGFGKTEIAARASFIVTFNGKQVIILVPTTILADQHYNVFLNRFKKFPINIKKITRHTSSIDLKNIYDGVSNGSIDILIGTHKVFSNKIKFKNLGLIIVDEEQRFGVKQKEKLKQIKSDVDYLAMSATPIPRTLYSAFSGIRDISIIATAPLGRKSITTSIIDFNIIKFKEIIEDEIKRSGQVFFLHNNITTLNNIKFLLKSVLPNVRMEIGYGGMKGLSDVIKDFKLKKFDVFISTSIIENGIDFPNVNTIIINQSFKFGLSQLYQFRGRVGRSDIPAFCYLVCPRSTFKNNRKIAMRLNALVKNQHVGSGFNISVKDLEIRGAGNLLGVKQHGNINKIGFDLYSQLVQKSVEELQNKN
jgi:transcription-repair coupling factor